LEQLRQCFDPEIPVNLVDLGLAYDCQLTKRLEGGLKMEGKMTLTAPGCGMGPAIAHDGKAKFSRSRALTKPKSNLSGPALESKHDQRSVPDEARNDLRLTLPVILSEAKNL
jgi:metal-sulfur cluster biosynthetic enzyme